MPVESPPSRWLYKCWICGRDTNLLYNGKGQCFKYCGYTYKEKEK